MADVFISYAHDDRESARQIATMLESKNYSVWWDRKLLAGDDYRLAIRQALDVVKKAIVLWSRKSVKSLWVIDEAQYALKQQKLVPLSIDNLDELDLPFGFAGIHAPPLGNILDGTDQIIAAIEGHPAPRELHRPQHTSRRLALVIGNSDYSVGGKLINPKNDADAVSRSLQKRGFAVIKLLDSNKVRMSAAIDRFLTMLAPGGVGLVFYGGRNYNDGRDDYFVPVDFPYADESKSNIGQAVNITELLRPIDLLVEGAPLNSGHVTIFSTSRGQFASDGPKDMNSPFTAAFIEALERNEFELSDVIRHVTRRVREGSNGKQLPCFEGALDTRFYFNDSSRDGDVGILKIIIFDSCRD